MKISSLPDKYQAQIRGQIAKGASSKGKTPDFDSGNRGSNPRAPATRTAIEFVIPIPPSVNHLFRTTDGKRYKTSEYGDYVNLVMQQLVFVQKVPHLSGEVALFAEIRRFSSMSDLDNRLKGLIDAVVASRVIDDDKHIIEIGAKWSKEVATCKVRIEPR